MLLLLGTQFCQSSTLNDFQLEAWLSFKETLGTQVAMCNQVSIGFGLTCKLIEAVFLGSNDKGKWIWPYFFFSSIFMSTLLKCIDHVGETFLNLQRGSHLILSQLPTYTVNNSKQYCWWGILHCRSFFDIQIFHISPIELNFLLFSEGNFLAQCLKKVWENSNIGAIKWKKYLKNYIFQ